MGYIKFLILLIFNIIACIRSSNPIAIPFSAFELVIIFMASNALYEKNRVYGYFLNLLLSLLFGIQTFVLFFSGEFVSALMLENTNMTSNLGKDLTGYIALAIPVLACIALPSRTNLKIKALHLQILTCGYVVASVFAIHISNGQKHSPLVSSASTLWSIGKISVHRMFRKQIDTQIISEQFKRDSIPGNGSTGLVPTHSDKPNVIIIFTEGMSAEVIDSYNRLGLGVTPSLDSLKAHSLVFDNYYNHTAATFRGLRGQLFSSHQELGGYYEDNSGLGQLDDKEMNRKMSTGMVSIIDILKECGYRTCFVNPEPGSPHTTSYLKNFRTDELATKEISQGEISENESISDKDVFEVLESTVLEYYKSGQPFLICNYNLGTHHGFDSPDIKFGDGRNAIFNKFFNYDYWLGRFLNRMNAAGVFDNTILVLTSDHASYPAPEYLKAFSSKQKGFISQIPLFIYTTGITPMTIDAKCRNSLTLAPTIIDILNIPQTRHRTNWFLGNSLFTNAGKFDRTAAIGEEFFQTSDGIVKPIRKGIVISEIKTYYEISVNRN